MFCCCVAYTDTPILWPPSKTKLKRCSLGSSYKGLAQDLTLIPLSPVARDELQNSRWWGRTAAVGRSASLRRLLIPCHRGRRGRSLWGSQRETVHMTFFIQHSPSTRQHLNWSVMLGLSNWLICPQDAAPCAKHLIAPGELVLCLILLQVQETPWSIGLVFGELKSVPELRRERGWGGGLVAGLPEWQQLRWSVCSFQHSPHQLLVFLWVHWACAVDHSLDFGD